MDSLRGQFADREFDDGRGYDPADDETGQEPPPSPVGQDERRMQVRAYNHWASLLGERSFPPIDTFDPSDLSDFGPHSVLLDFTSGIDDPHVRYLGEALAQECSDNEPIRRLSDVPSRSLLSRITDHYMQILANQAPIGFEAEFVNLRGVTVLYRGILLPFSSDGRAIDYIYGVINWKELADQQTTDELLLEIDQALDARNEFLRDDAPLTEWADGPADMDVLDLVTPYESHGDEVVHWPQPAFGAAELPGAEPDCSVADELGVLELTEVDESAMGLADCLAAARELAQAAHGSEDRSRQALYAAVGRAYDFSLAAAAQPDEFAELLADAGLSAQERAPMTPVVKLVFGAEYDKTRLAEFASALGHAHRLSLPSGALAGFLGGAPGGLKGVVREERRLKREESGKAVEARDTPRAALARKLRKLDHHPLAQVPAEGSEFTLLVARRLPDGEVVLLGEVADDVPLLERAARRLFS